MEFIENIPLDHNSLYTAEELSIRLKGLINQPFKLTGKIRTDGVNARKVIADQLKLSLDKKDFIDNGNVIVSKKGTPKMRRQLLYTYLATPPYDTGNYNLQMWNFDFNNLSEPIVYDQSGNVVFRYEDVKMLILWVDRDEQIIKSVSVLTPQTVNQHFSTRNSKISKSQARITDLFYEQLRNAQEHIFVGKDNVLNYNEHHWKPETSCQFTDYPSKESILSLSFIGEKLKPLIGLKIEESDVRNMGRTAEKMVIQQLGYLIDNTMKLHGHFPDIPHQLLEVKLQNQFTIDLGKYSPFEEQEISHLNTKTKDVRYCFIITDEQNVITNIALLYGREFHQYFNPVQSSSFKTQIFLPLNDMYFNHIGEVYTL